MYCWVSLANTVNSPNITDTLVQGLLSAIRCMSVIEELLLYPHSTLEPDMEWKFLANIGYMSRVNIYIPRLRGYIQSLVDREL